MSPPEPAGSGQAGATGPAETVGSTGPTGAAGSTAPAEAAGATGPTGPTGPTGTRSSARPTPEPPITTSSGMQAARALLAFLPPVTLITGLLFYFGWARIDQQARALGADASVFGYSTRDYLLRSVDSLFLPFMVLTAVGLLCLVAHQFVVGELGTVTPENPHDLLSGVGVALFLVGALLAGYGLLYSLGGVDRNRFVDVSGPLALGLGALLSAYGGWLHRRARGARQVGAWGADSPAPWAAPLAAGLLLSFVALSLFWSVGNFAQWRGQELALEIANEYRSRPGVLVYSPVRLALEGVTEAILQEPGQDPYAYRYSGMRLLDHAGGTYFLMPEDWALGHRLILLKDSADLRVELLAG